MPHSFTVLNSARLSLLVIAFFCAMARQAVTVAENSGVLLFYFGARLQSTPIGGGGGSSATFIPQTFAEETTIQYDGGGKFAFGVTLLGATLVGLSTMLILNVPLNSKKIALFSAVVNGVAILTFLISCVITSRSASHYNADMAAAAADPNNNANPFTQYRFSMGAGSIALLTAMPLLLIASVLMLALFYFRWIRSQSVVTRLLCGLGGSGDGSEMGTKNNSYNSDRIGGGGGGGGGNNNKNRGGGSGDREGLLSGHHDDDHETGLGGGGGNDHHNHDDGSVDPYLVFEANYESGCALLASHYLNPRRFTYFIVVILQCIAGGLAIAGCAAAPQQILLPDDFFTANNGVPTMVTGTVITTSGAPATTIPPSTPITSGETTMATTTTALNDTSTTADHNAPPLAQWQLNMNSDDGHLYHHNEKQQQKQQHNNHYAFIGVAPTSTANGGTITVAWHYYKTSYDVTSAAIPILYGCSAVTDLLPVGGAFSLCGSVFAFLALVFSSVTTVMRAPKSTAVTVEEGKYFAFKMLNGIKARPANSANVGSSNRRHGGGGGNGASGGGAATATTTTSSNAAAPPPTAAVHILMEAPSRGDEDEGYYDTNFYLVPALFSGLAAAGTAAATAVLLTISSYSNGRDERCPSNASPVYPPTSIVGTSSLTISPTIVLASIAVPASLLALVMTILVHRHALSLLFDQICELKQIGYDHYYRNFYNNLVREEREERERLGNNKQSNNNNNNGAVAHNHHHHHHNPKRPSAPGIVARGVVSSRVLPPPPPPTHGEFMGVVGGSNNNGGGPSAAAGGRHINNGGGGVGSRGTAGGGTTNAQAPAALANNYFKRASTADFADHLVEEAAVAASLVHSLNRPLTASATSSGGRNTNGNHSGGGRNSPLGHH